MVGIVHERTLDLALLDFVIVILCISIIVQDVA
jgi:hypothetical protein